MKHVVLRRFAYVPGYGAFGKLEVRLDPRLDPTFSCYTVERPWMGNMPRLSCIPEDRYKMRISWFNRGGYKCWELDAVRGRSEILIHKANLPTEVEGCIALGQTIGALHQAWAVMNSSEAFRDFMHAMETDETATLLVTHYEADG